MFGKSIKLGLALLLGVLCSFSFAQEVTPPKQETLVEEVSNNKFRRSLLQAADKAAKAGEIKRADVVRLRVASLSPAFLERAEQLALIQMSFSGEDVPVTDEGKIDVAKIDWEALLDFIERLIPLILKLIDLFAMYSDPSTVFVVWSSIDAPDFIFVLSC